MAANLAPVFLNDARVTLQGDPRPQVSKILAATGKRPDAVEVVWLRSPGDSQGKPLRPDEFIDRAKQANTPVYLKCVDKPGGAATGESHEEGPGSGMGMGSPAAAGPSASSPPRQGGGSPQQGRPSPTPAATEPSQEPQET